MLTTISVANAPSRSSRRDRALQYDGLLRTPFIGCTDCKDALVCGGLKIKQAVFNCLQFCCRCPESCDAVCRNNPVQFASRVREIGGFGFDNIPKLKSVAAPVLPPVIPVIYHRIGRKQIFAGSPAIALPLYKVIGRHGGEPRYRSRKEVAHGCGIPEDATIILTGSGRDDPLERW